MSFLTQDDQRRIESAVENLKLLTGLSYPENNLLDIANALGVEVFETDLSHLGNVNGVIQYFDDQKNQDVKIYLNSDYPPERKTFTLAHELGHYLLHPYQEKYRIDAFNYSEDSPESKAETEANYFAACLLVPKDKLLIALEHEKDLAKVASVLEFLSLSSRRAYDG